MTTGPASSICQARAPSSESAASTAAARDCRVPGGGRGPQHPAQVVGGEHVLDRQPLLLGQLAERRAGQAEPAGGDRVAVGPGAGERRSVGAGGAGRQLGLVHRRDRPERGDPARGVALRAAAVEPLHGQQGVPVGGHGLGGGDDRRVGDDPARGDVAALGELVADLPQGSHRTQATAAADPVHPRRTTPRFHARDGLEGEQGLELLPRPLVLAGFDELCGQRRPELHEHLDVERGVLQPRLRQRPPRPVDRRVLLLHPPAEHGLDQGGQADAGVAEQPPGQLGVEQRTRAQADLAQARQVLGGGVQDPLGALERGGQRGQRLERDRVDQPGAGVLAAELDEVGATGVAVARGPLGVDRDRSGAGHDRGARLGQPGLGVGDRRAALRGAEQRSLGHLRARRGPAPRGRSARRLQASGIRPPSRAVPGGSG